MNNSYLRYEADQLLKGRYTEAFLMFLLVFSVSFVFGWLTELFAPQYDFNWMTGQRILLSPGNPSLYALFYVVSLIIGAFLSYVMQKFYIRVSEDKLASKLELFLDGFMDQPLRTVLTGLLVFIYTFLWLLLFIIPGLIKAYAYSMWLYLLDKDPSLLANEAITLSNKLTKGYKLRLFLMDLYFVFIYVALMIFFYILFRSSSMNPFFFVLIFILLLVVFIGFIYPKYMTSRTLLFKEIYEGYYGIDSQEMPESPEVSGLL